jgi:pimeloyl-ACP methyl ester carboxylesterase
VFSDSEFKNVTRGDQTWRFHDSGEGPPVVLFHGFPDTPHSYADIARTLNEAGYRAIVPYLRGYHPDTIVPGRGYDALSLAEDVVGLLDALELESAALVGHDWGATLLYGAAAIAPERVNALVPIAIAHPKTLKPKGLLQTIGLFFMSRHFIYFQMPWSEAGTRRNDFAYIERLYRRWAPGWQGPERDAALARTKEAFSNPEVLKASIDYYRALFAKTDRPLKRLNAPIKAPGLLVAGGKDFGGHLGPYKQSQALFEAGAEILVMPDAGHWPHQEDPTKFQAALIRFLRGTGSSSKTGSIPAT